jgi:hypothetical protein
MRACWGALKDQSLGVAALANCVIILRSLSLFLWLIGAPSFALTSRNTLATFGLRSSFGGFFLPFIELGCPGRQKDGLAERGRGVLEGLWEPLLSSNTLKTQVLQRIITPVSQSLSALTEIPGNFLPVVSYLGSLSRGRLALRLQKEHSANVHANHLAEHEYRASSPILRIGRRTAGSSSG